MLLYCIRVFVACISPFTARTWFSAIRTDSSIVSCILLCLTGSRNNIHTYLILEKFILLTYNTVHLKLSELYIITLKHKVHTKAPQQPLNGPCVRDHFVYYFCKLLFQVEKLCLNLNL